MYTYKLIADENNNFSFFISGSSSWKIWWTLWLSIFYILFNDSSIKLTKQKNNIATLILASNSELGSLLFLETPILISLV